MVSKRTNPEATSKRVAKIASKQLRSPKTSKAAKSTAGSALTNAPNKKKGGGKKKKR